MCDTIITHGRVWTVDERQPIAEAVAIDGDRIVAVGGTGDVLRSYRTADTRTIDAGGRCVLPGFNDAHLHFVPGGAQLDDIDLRGTSDPAEFRQRIAERARMMAAGEWMLGGGWDEQAWRPAALPTRELIDDVTRSTPVFVTRSDIHMGLANSAALAAAGVSRNTPDPPGGTIGRDSQGKPTGILKDAAMGLVNRVVPPMTPERRLRAIKRALAHVASLGVTSVQDMDPEYDEIEAYDALARSGELTTRIYAAPLETDWLSRVEAGSVRYYDSPFLRTSAVKGFSDGSLGSATAWFFEPYCDAPDTRGLLSDEMQSIDAVRSRLLAADQAGLQLCIHAIGDRANSLVLDLFGDIARLAGPRDRRLRIEHAQHVAPPDFARFAAQPVIASVQPYHAIDDGRWAEKRIGAARVKTTHAYRTFLDHGVRLAFGTDWPVAPVDPLLTLYAATTRATLDGAHPGGWGPEQKLTIAEAVHACTLGAAYAQFSEHEKGSISPGKLADLAILSDDVMTVPAEDIRNVKVDVTIVGGKIVYER